MFIFCLFMFMCSSPFSWHHNFHLIQFIHGISSGHFLIPSPQLFHGLFMFISYGNFQCIVCSWCVHWSLLRPKVIHLSLVSSTSISRATHCLGHGYCPLIHVKMIHQSLVIHHSLHHQVKCVALKRFRLDYVIGSFMHFHTIQYILYNIIHFNSIKIHSFIPNIKFHYTNHKKVHTYRENYILA